MILGDMALGDYVFGGIDPDFTIETTPVPSAPFVISRDRRRLAADIEDVGHLHRFFITGEPFKDCFAYVRDVDTTPEHGQQRIVEQRMFVAYNHYNAAGFLRPPKRGDEVVSTETEESWYVEEVETDRRRGYVLRWILFITGHQHWDSTGERATLLK
mgnify:CR=1 FL=1